MAYDAFGRMVSEAQTDAAGQAVRQITRTFDGWGRERSSTEALRGVRSESTWSGQTRDSHSLGYGETTVTVTTDGSGRETSLEANRGPETVLRELARDTAGKVTGLTLDAGTALSQSRAYDTGSGVLTSQDGAGLGSAGIDYEYSEATSRQVREAIDLAYPATSADRDRTFVHDEAGRVVKSTGAGSTETTFTHTSDGRITGAGGRTFAYREEPARSQQLLSMTENGVTAAFSFDGRGRRSGYTSASESVTYTYDDSDRMTGFARDTGADGTIDVSASYSYDASGQRARSVVTSAGVTTTTEWTHEGLTLLRAESVTGTSTTTVEYVNDPDGRPAAAWVKVPAHATAVFVWLVTDARGDVLGLITSEGTPLSHRAYGAWGERIAGASRAAAGLSQTAAEQVDAAITLGYAGYTFDAESGLAYCSQRYYDPVTCQWTTKDPARADGEESAYQYCGGDPVGKVDPSGLWAWVTWHKISSTTGARGLNARLVRDVVVRSIVQDLAAKSLLAAIPGASRLVAAYDIFSAYSTAATAWRTAGKYKKGDLIILLRSTFAYYAPSCHYRTRQWKVWYTTEHQRAGVVKGRGAQRSFRVSVPRSHGTRRPFHIGWPRKVHGI